MAWLISFILSWIVFLIFVDRKKLNFTLYGGLITLALGTLVDWAGNELGLYSFHNHLIRFAGNSFFYSFGPIFTMGVLFFQFLQRDKVAQMANIIAFSLTYLSIEYLIVQSGTAQYLHWHYLASFIVDILVFSALSFFGEIIRDKLEPSGGDLYD